MAFGISDRVSLWHMCQKFCMIVTAIGAYIIVAISRPDNMQLHELILTQILIC